MIAIGCDVSKGYADVAVFKDDGEQIFPVVKIDDSQQGEKKYLELLEKIKNRFQGEKIVVAMEVTGGYETNLASFFNRVKDEFNLEMFVLNPKPIKKFKEIDLHFASTDETAAQGIALFVITKYPELEDCYVESPKLRAMRKTVKSIDSLGKEVARAKNQLENLLFTTFPEVIPLLREDKPVWLLKAIQLYPIPLKLKKAKYKSLIKIHNITEDKAKRLIALAKKSRGADNHVEFISVIKEKIELLLLLIDREKSLKKRLNKVFVEDFPDNHLVSINGVGSYSAAVVMAFVGNVNRFSNVKKFTAFFGLDPVVVESGDGIKKRKISKRGVSLVRKTLFMDCFSILSIKAHPVSKFYYKLKEQGRNHLYAMVACMRKLLGIIYAILVSGNEFKIDYEDSIKAEQQSKTDCLRKKMGTANLKVASFDTDAPISKREVKKRRLLKNIIEMEKIPNVLNRVKP